MIDACIGQELLNWEGSPLMLDVFSLFTPQSSILARPNRGVQEPSIHDGGCVRQASGGTVPARVVPRSSNNRPAVSA
jgi:hypothetical protein